jgi:hypothetical protein
VGGRGDAVGLVGLGMYVVWRFRPCRLWKEIDCCLDIKIISLCFLECMKFRCDLAVFMFSVPKSDPAHHSASESDLGGAGTTVPRVLDHAQSF